MVVEFEQPVEKIDIPEGKILGHDGNSLSIQFDRDRISAYALISTIAKSHEVKDISIVDESIETIVTKIYEGNA